MLSFPIKNSPINVIIIVIVELNRVNVINAIKHNIIPAIFVLVNSNLILLVHNAAPTIKIKNTNPESKVGLFNAGVLPTNVVLDDEIKFPIFNR